MKKHYLIKTLFAAFILCGLTSCATTINVKMTRPAELDLNGAQTIAVLPFKPYAYYEVRDDARGAELAIGIFFQVFDRVGPEEKRCIDCLQSEVEHGLLESPYIDVVSSTAVSNAIRTRTKNPADVYLTGEITYFNIHDEKNQYRRKVRDGDEETGRKPEYELVEEYKRNVQIDFRYEVVDSYSNKIISYNKVRISDSSGSYDRIRDLPSAFSIVEYELKSSARKILKELQPYVITKTITLKEDKTKNPEFKYADKLAKDGYIQESYEEFKALYDDTDMWQAGYNAAVLKEAMGDLSEAEKQMSALYKKFKTEEIAKGLADIKNEIRQTNRLKQQTENSDVLDTDF